MKHTYLLTTTVLIVGASGFAFARQQNTPAHNKAATIPAKNRDADGIAREEITRTPPDLIAAVRRENMRHRIYPLLKQADAAMKQKRYADAEQLFRKLIALDDEDGRYWLALADVCERQNKPQQALAAYRKLIYPQNWSDNVSSDVTTRMRYVLALCGINQYTEAVQVFNAAMNAMAIEDMSDAGRQQVAQTRDAMTHDAAVSAHSLLPMRFDPNDPDKRLLQAAAHFVLGTKRPSFVEPGKGEMMKHLQAAVRLAPQWGRVYSALADALIRQGNHQAAQVAQARALALGDHSSNQEDLYRVLDKSAREHMLRFHPNEPERYQFHDPTMIPTQAERDAAAIELKKRNADNPIVPKNN